MIYAFTHPGSGLGNQLFRYLAVRVLALEKGYDFCMVGRKNFKGKSFMNLDMGKPETFPYMTEYHAGKLIADVFPKIPWEEKSPYYNPEFNFVEDGTIIDGEFQDERYFGKYLEIIDDWLAVEPINIPGDVCVIGFRGGEFYTVPELGLPLSYFEEGIEIMKKIIPDMKFEVHTDDEVLAQKFFPNFKIIHDIAINWRSIRCAKYAIIANSSFYILPRLLRHQYEVRQKGDLKWRGWAGTPLTIAPRYWDRYNIREWLHPYNYYKSFKYI